ncbi:MAG: RsmD family RNA methyltransferase, partial [Armatimonadetes bacterium]|nr:RsmD family RNA methyltransferase [Armatimonadota bacterium]
AGSGAVGLEALSRGAEKVVFIEKDWRNISIIKENLIKIKKSALVIKGDVLKTLKKISGEEFNIIFSDPPYQTEITEKLFSLILNHELLAKDGWLILEHYHKEEPIKNLDIRLAFVKKYGQTILSFYLRR